MAYVRFLIVEHHKNTPKIRNVVNWGFNSCANQKPEEVSHQNQKTEYILLACVVLHSVKMRLDYFKMTIQYLEKTDTTIATLKFNIKKASPVELRNRILSRNIYRIKKYAGLFFSKERKAILGLVKVESLRLMVVREHSSAIHGVAYKSKGCWFKPHWFLAS